MKRIMVVIAALAAASAVQAADDAKSKQAAQKERIAQCTRGADERKMKGERRAGYIQQCARSAAAGASRPKVDAKGKQRGGEMKHPDINKNVPDSGG